MGHERPYKQQEWFEHLNMIQGVINRLAHNSFLLKGWAVTLISAVLAVIAAREAPNYLALVALLPAVVFWGLDAYYLRQERLFRNLYDYIRVAGDPEKGGPIEPFTMHIGAFTDEVQSWFRTLWSRTISPLYGVIVIVILLIALLVIP